MAISDTLAELATDISNAYDSIEDKGGTLPQSKNTNNLATAIDSIHTGITPSGTINITENGTVNVTNYATADVDVVDQRVSDKIDIGLFTPEVDSYQYSVSHNLGRVPIGAIVFEAEGATLADIPESSIALEYMLLFPNGSYGAHVSCVNADRSGYLTSTVGDNTYKPSYDENQVTFATGRYYGAKFLAGRKYQYIIF